MFQYNGGNRPKSKMMHLSSSLPGGSTGAKYAVSNCILFIFRTSAVTRGWYLGLGFYLKFMIHILNENFHVCQVVVLCVIMLVIVTRVKLLPTMTAVARIGLSSPFVYLHDLKNRCS